MPQMHCWIASLRARAIKPVIPPKANRKNKRDCDFALYRERNLVEQFFQFIKHFRGIAVRGAKLGARRGVADFGEEVSFSGVWDGRARAVSEADAVVGASFMEARKAHRRRRTDSRGDQGGWAAIEATICARLGMSRLPGTLRRAPR